MSRKRLILTAVVLVLVLAIGGILAYFTDVQTRTNRFKTGEVNILVDEPSWPVGEDPIPNPEYDPDNPDPNIPETIIPQVPVVPGQETPKDPQVTNLGDGDVYAFVEVTIPVRNVKVGNAQSASPTQLFTILHKGATEGTSVAGINRGWVKVSQTPAENEITASTTSVTYVYAYASNGATQELTPLAKNATTVPVFDSVRFVDVTETEYSSNSEIQGQSFEVVVKGYGIQADGLSSSVPSEVWPQVK